MVRLLILINLKPSLLTKKNKLHKRKDTKCKEDIQIAPSVKLLGITIDNRLNFNKHISSIYKSTANRLNTLVRPKTFLGFNEGKVLVNNFVLFPASVNFWNNRFRIDRFFETIKFGFYKGHPAVVIFLDVEKSLRLSLK